MVGMFGNAWSSSPSRMFVMSGSIGGKFCWPKNSLKVSWERMPEDKGGLWISNESDSPSTFDSRSSFNNNSIVPGDNISSSSKVISLNCDILLSNRRYKFNKTCKYRRVFLPVSLGAAAAETDD